MAHSLCIHRFYWTVRLRPIPDMIMASFSITFDAAIAPCVPDENDGNRTDCHAAISAAMGTFHTSHWRSECR